MEADYNELDELEEELLEDDFDPFYDLLPIDTTTQIDNVVTTVVKNPLIKGRKDPEEKAWETLVKRIFSSFSGRRAMFSFFDVVTDKNTVVLCNDGDAELGIYANRHVGFHIVTFKDAAAARILLLRQQLNINDKPGIKTVLGATYLQLRNKFLKTGYQIWTRCCGAETYAGETKTDDPNGYKLIVSPLVSPSRIQNLTDSVKSMSDNYTALGNDKRIPVYVADVAELIRYDSITTSIKIDISKLIHNGVPCFPNCGQYFNVVMHDGVSMPCVKEFLRKTPKDTCSFKIYAWVPLDPDGNPSRHFKVLLVYEDEDVFILSAKPHINYFPITQKEKVDVK